MPHIGVVIGHLEGLLVDGVSHLGAAITDVDAVQAGKAVDEFATIHIDDIDAFASGNHPARRIAMGKVTQVRGSVEGDLAVAIDQILVRGHAVLH